MSYLISSEKVLFEFGKMPTDMLPNEETRAGMKNRDWR